MHAQNYIGRIALAALLMVPLAAGAQEKKPPVSERKQARPAGERGTNSNFGTLHQRLANVIQQMKYPEGPITFKLGSGRYFDIPEWRRYMYFSRAVVNMTGGAIRSIEFIYTQYNIKSGVKETKSYLLENPGAAETPNVVVMYQLGGKTPTRYRLDELPAGETGQKVIDQYRDRLFELVRTLEALKGTRDQAKINLVNRVVDLDQFMQ